MKKLVALLLALVMLFALAACGDSPAANDPVNSGASGPSAGSQTGSDNSSNSNAAPASTVEKMLSLEPDTSRKSTANTDEKYAKITVPNDEVSDLLPYNNLSGAKNGICIEIYETLFDNIDGELRGHLAKGYEEIDDTHVQVTIFDNIYDWEGNKITADDVVFSYNLCLGSGYADNFSYFEKAEAIDPYTVEFTWNEPITSLTSFNSMMQSVCIVSEKAYNEHNFVVDPVGTGPYILKSFTAGVSVILEANDNYWQTDDALRSPFAKANVQEIEYDVLGDSTMQVIALESGALDYCEISSQNIQNYIDSDDYTVCTLENPFLTALLLNQSPDSPCQDINLRLAIYYAIDNAAIVDAIGAFSYYPASACAATVYGDYQSSWETKENYNTVYDLELAKDYLKKSSYNGETLTILTNSLEQNKNSATIILGFLQELGIKAEIFTTEPPAVDGVACNTDSWDLLLAASRSDSGLCISRICADFLPASVPYGMVKTFVDDDKLQEMIETCNTKDGYSVELTQEIMDYMIENAYTYGLFGNIRVYAFTPVFADFTLYNNNTALVLGSCDYYLD